MLKNNYIKCGACGKKYSLKKLQKDMRIIELFCENFTAKEVQRELHVNYITIHSRYVLFRKLILRYLDQQHEQSSNLPQEYDEYIYCKNNNLFEAQNFLTFTHHNQKVYNVMLPSLYKFKANNHTPKELKKFLFLNKIAKLQSKHSHINKFWHFLETLLKQYKGVTSEHFIYFLKEAEFKFNHTQKEQKTILKQLWLYM